MAPNVFGPLVLAALVTFAAALPLVALYRGQLALAERSGAICGFRPGRDARAAPGGERLFTTDAMCWDSGREVEKGKRYEVRMLVVEPWEDGTVAASPEGFEPGRIPWLLGYLALPLRRSLGGGWFQPFVTIRGEGKAGRAQALEFHFTGSAYAAAFTAAATGRAYIWVNDAALDWRGLTGRYYKYNQGTASVCIAPAGAPCPASRP